MSAARRAALAATALTLGACGLEVGPTASWVDVATVDGPLTAKAGQPADGGPVAMARPTTLRIVTFNVEMGADATALAAAIRANPAIAAADVYLVQEEEDYPEEGAARAARLGDALGLRWIYVPGRVKGSGTHGLAIMARYPITAPAKMALPMIEKGQQRIALRAGIELGDWTLPVVDVHLETRLNITDRILHLRPALLDLPDTVVVAGDVNTNPYLWEDGTVPLIPAAQVVDTDQAPILDDYMAGLGFATPSAGVGPTETKYGVESRLDAIYTRGLTVGEAHVERSVAGSDHWPVWVDVTLP